METSVNNECKAFTSLEQSKVLAEILPLESADMEYLAIKENGELVGVVPFVKDYSEVEDSAYNHTYDRIACWSLAALLEQLKAEIQLKNKQILFLHINKYDDINCDIRYTNSWTGEVFITEADNLVDACVAMILKLHELKLLRL